MHVTSKSSGATSLMKSFIARLASAGERAVSSYMLFKFFTTLGEMNARAFEFTSAFTTFAKPLSRSAREEFKSPSYTAATAEFTLAATSVSPFAIAAANAVLASGNLNPVRK